MIRGATHTSHILVFNADEQNNDILPLMFKHSVLTSKYSMPTYVHTNFHPDTQSHDIYIYIHPKNILSNTLYILNTTSYILQLKSHLLPLDLSFPGPRALSNSFCNSNTTCVSSLRCPVDLFSRMISNSFEEVLRRRPNSRRSLRKMQPVFFQ